jgi:MoaA/NifB/PqqE/SkfB family radical SAM enzyme
LLKKSRFHFRILRAYWTGHPSIGGWVNYVLYKTLHSFYRRFAPGAKLPFAPCSVSLWLTARCNMSCSFCHYDGELLRPTSSELPMSFDQFVALYEENNYMRKALRFALYGGEPLLRDDLPRFIAFLKARGHLVSINTNGLLLKKRLHELEADPPHFLTVSYYPENRAALEKILPAVTAIVPVRLNVLIFDGDLSRIQPALALARSTKVDLVAIDNFVPNGNPGHAAAREDTPGLKEARKAYGRALTMDWPPTADAPKNLSARTRCGFFWNSIFIDERGRHSACCAWKRETYQPLGADMWNSASMRALRVAMAKGDPPSFCRGCRGLYTDTSAI